MSQINPARTIKNWQTYMQIDPREKNFADRANLEATFGAGYLSPTDEQIRQNNSRILNFLRSKCILIIPMREYGPTIRSLLEIVTHQIPLSSIIIIDNGSDEAALAEVRRHSVRLISCDEVLDGINWNRLLPILNLEMRPKGKGVAVFAGYILAHALAKESLGRAPAWVFQHDADVVEYAKHRALDYLAWAILQTKGASQHIKIAQSGRNNESVMAARSALLALHGLNFVSSSEEIHNVQIRARELFEHLARIKWMLSGAFALPWDIAMRRPFATGYLEETLICAFAEDIGAMSGNRTVQVTNPVPCLDGLSDFRKEGILMQSVSNFLINLALIRMPVHKWTIGDISTFNHQLMATKLPVALIPPDEKPVIVEMVPQERILPSVEMMHEEGLLDQKVVLKAVHS